jgi:hypothetical protein
VLAEQVFLNLFLWRLIENNKFKHVNFSTEDYSKKTLTFYPNIVIKSIIHKE